MCSAVVSAQGDPARVAAAEAGHAVHALLHRADDVLHAGRAAEGGGILWRVAASQDVAIHAADATASPGRAGK